jgi:DNA-directed RNA polymerase beta subunit
MYDLPLPANCRGWFDPLKTRQWVFDTAVAEYTKVLNKLESKDFKLEVSDIHVELPTQPISFSTQKQAILDSRDVTVPLRGTVKMIDKHSGAVVDSKKTTIAQLPYITERNTTILNGSEYVTGAQQRLKAGTYTRIRDSGEAEAHVNVIPGSGMGGKLIFFPDKALFVYMLASTQIKLYGLLKDLGVPDSSMQEAWGAEIFAKNKSSYEGTEIDKFYSKIFSEE